MVDGVYQWKPENMKKAHAACLKKYAGVLQYMDHGECTRSFPPNQVNTLIVDNTNISVWEIAPYYALAEAYGANVKIVSFDPSVLEAFDCFKRNVHNVPEINVKRMFKNMQEEQRSFPHHWNIEYVLPHFEEIPA